MVASLSAAEAQIDPEVGPNDFQLTTSGGARYSDIGYSPQRQEYLASWYDSDYQDLVVQRLDGLGVPIGGPVVTGLGHPNQPVVVTHDSVNDRFLIVSDLGFGLAGVLVDSDGTVGAPFSITGETWTTFDVAFNPDLEEYAVCRSQQEIWLRRVSSDGQVLGLQDIPLGLSSIRRKDPRIVYNPVEQEYLLTELHEHDDGGDEVWAWRLDDEVQGFESSRISSASSTNQGVLEADVEYNPVHNEYLVVWIHGLGDTPTDGQEVYGQRLDALAQEVGPDDFKISTMGRPGHSEPNAWSPRIRFNLVRDRYLVVWTGDDTTGDMAAGEFEIFGQYLSWGGGLLPPGNFRLSDFGPTGDAEFDALDPSVAYNPDRDEFLTLFVGVEGIFNNNDIYGQRVYGAPTIFDDGFETGGTHRWSSTTAP